MATVRLGRYEVKELRLLSLCMQCGAEATAHVRKTFSWQPSWIIVLILFGLLPYLIVSLILTKRMTIEAPLCDQHKNHWFWRNWFIYGGLVFFLGLGVAAIVVLSSQGNQRGATNALGGLLCGATALGGLIWLIAAAIIQQAGIRPTEITDQSITLTHVSPTFVDGLAEMRMRPQDDDSR
jgi:hypothetical protein